MKLEFDSQVPNIPSYKNLIALCLEIFSKNIDIKFKNTIVSISIVSEELIQKLNAQYRGKNKVTDVLSFNLMDNYNTPDLFLGEIFICYKKALEQSQYLNHSIDYEIATLCIHGLCHLIGYDHQTDTEYEKMKIKENEVLELLKQTGLSLE
jgi:probable rRNA maturation factor